MIYLCQGSNRTDFYPPRFCFMGNPLLTEFISTSRTTIQRASGHLNFSFFPVNLRVVFVEPGVSKQEFLFTQVSDTKGGLFQVVLVMEEKTDCFCYQASFIGDPSTFYTGIGWVNFIRLNQQLLAYCLSINSPVSPESTRVVMDFFLAVSVVSISTFNFSEFGVPSMVAIVSFSGKAFSHFGFHFLGISRVWVWTGIGISFAHLRKLFWNQIYFLMLWNDYKWTTGACSSLVVLYNILFLWNLILHSHQ